MASAIQMIIDGIRCIAFEGSRSKPATAPEGFPFAYMTRHNDRDFSMPITVEDFACVNFWGFLYAEKEFPKENGGGTFHEIKRLESKEYGAYRIDKLGRIYAI